MTITHIIPSAFDYFDDIKKNAFEIVEELQPYGINSHVITLQYNQPTKSQQAEIIGERGPAPSYKFKGNSGLKESFIEMAESDLVHLHCPFMGGAKSILDFKLRNADLPLVCTYYRPVETPDVFSLIIKAYNAYYLPKIFQLANVVGVFDQTFKKYKFAKLDEQKIIDFNVGTKEEITLNLPLTNNPDRLKYNDQLTARFSLSKLMSVYDTLLH